MAEQCGNRAFALPAHRELARERMPERVPRDAVEVRGFGCGKKDFQIEIVRAERARWFIRGKAPKAATALIHLPDLQFTQDALRFFVEDRVLYVSGFGLWQGDYSPIKIDIGPLHGSRFRGSNGLRSSRADHE